MSTQNNLDEAYWTSRYDNNTSTWDLGIISPPIKAFCNTLKNKNISILIPGCGNGHEAQYLLDLGFTNITLIDISPVPVENMKGKFKANLGKEIKVILGDFFELNKKYDLIIEQTFFCALDPSLRQKYADTMPERLTNKGILAGLYFDFQFEKNPPFGGTTMEYINLFTPKFKSVKFSPCYNSIESRMGREVFGIMKK